MFDNGFTGIKKKNNNNKNQYKNIIMKYRVHRLEVQSENMQEKLEQFLNKLDGEVISVIPNVTHYFLMYGARVNYILIVEKIK